MQKKAKILGRGEGLVVHPGDIIRMLIICKLVVLSQTRRGKIRAPETRNAAGLAGGVVKFPEGWPRLARRLKP